MIEIHIGKGEDTPLHSDFRDRGEEAGNEEQLSELADIIMKAEEIKANTALYRAVQAHMGRKEKKYRSIADLRGEAGRNKDHDKQEKKEEKEEPEEYED